MKVLLLDGRAHGQILTVPQEDPTLWISMKTGKPTLVQPGTPRFKDRLEQVDWKTERYRSLTGLRPNIKNEHPYGCTRLLPPSPPNPRDGRTAHDIEHDETWTARLREFLHPLQQAEPPDDEKNKCLWMELDDILHHLNKYRNPVIQLPE